MAQINLLKQKTTNEAFWSILPSIMAKLLGVGVVALIGYYIWLFITLGSIGKQIVSEQQAMVAAQQKASNVFNRNEVYTRQAQLQQLSGLIGKHFYWSNLFPALAKVTLKNASYGSLTATKEGSLTLSVKVPDLVSVDKFLQVFDQPDFSKNFNNLRLGAFRKLQNDPVTGQSSGYQFDVLMNFNPEVIQFNNEID